MTRVKPKLYLNMSPETVEEGGLIFARNMKVDDDGHLTSDYGYKDLNLSQLSGKTIVGHIVGLDNKVYLIATDSNHTYIYEYDEISRIITDSLIDYITYHNGKITGYVSTNISGEKILTISEYDGDEDVPLKHINLSFRGSDGDESIFTQAPGCPTANLILEDTYVKTIPNGVYVFFIRYRLRKDVYTDWFLCSRPIFGGTSESISTLQGGLKYVNLHKDSAKSFVFRLSFPVSTNKDAYDEFQLGFIITHDEATDARIWKSFEINQFVNSPSGSQNLIYFDYEDVTETNIDTLLASTYELYNVKNIANFKNKLYISNYKESNFNPSEIQDLASRISLQVAHSGDKASSAINMKFNGTSLNYNSSKGYFDSYGRNRNISNLLNRSHFTYNIHKLSKINTKEKEEVATFNIAWNADRDPDIAFVVSMSNSLLGDAIFGSSLNDTIPSSNTDNTKIEPLGLHRNENNMYRPLYTNPKSAGNHPFYKRGFSFCYGSADGVPIFCNPLTYYNSANGWDIKDSGFRGTSFDNIKDNAKKEITNRVIFAQAYLEISNGATTYTIGYHENMDRDNYVGVLNFNFLDGSGNPYSDYQTNSYKYYEASDLYILNPSYATDSISTAFRDVIERLLFGTIVGGYFGNDRVSFEGIDENGVVVLSINGNIVRTTAFNIRFKKFEFTVDTEDIKTTENEYNQHFKVNLKTTDYSCFCQMNIKPEYIVSTYEGVSDITQASTLMPFSTYKPYVHFVDEHNIVTNGVPLSSINVGANTSEGDIISLQYRINTRITNSKYKSFFISLINIGDIVIEGFAFQYVGNNFYVLQCLEIDTLLYNINDNITVRNKSGSFTISNAKYYSSGEVRPSVAFGNCGFVGFYSSTSLSTSDTYYVIIERNKNLENINSLTKASGYIAIPSGTTSYANVPDGYYGSWRCTVKKPSFNLSSTCYVSGKDVYAADRRVDFSLVDFNSYIQIQDSPSYVIRSNFNLNYLSLTKDIVDSIFSVGSASSGVKQVAKVINSAILSFIYELKSMYKDFSNKYFRKFETNNKIDFDNTIRVSNVLSDETFNNSVFKFEATNYYNVPTDRGVIVLLFSIGNNIFVHTKGSLYKFDANQTIMASESDITLKEAEPFDAGISQILDSQYGYGGIDNKEAGCITFDSYFFYDRFSTHIFAYGGNSQIQLIDASIYKLLKYYSPTHCATLHDDVNHRVLFNFKTEVGNTLKNLFTISYNYKAKSFVSIHDIDLTNSFAGRTRDFSYNGVSSFFELFNTDTPISDAVVPESEGLNIYKLFGDASIASDLFIHDLQTSPFNVAIVMFPANTLRETINSIKYIGETITDYIDTIEDEDEENPFPTYDLIHIPRHNNVNPVKSLQIVTDTCISNVISTTVDDTVRPDHTITDYKGFKHEIDSWNANYFRSIINAANIYHYDEDARELQPITPDLISDRNSLVYGKYYVLVFNFIKNVPIKFEEIFINSERY